MRIQGYDVTVDDQGREAVSVALAQESVTV
jgi:hypothetical protein